MSWRLRKEQAGGGALMDLGSHLIDLTRFLLDEFKEVSASTRTFIHDRPLFPEARMRGLVDVDDAAFLHATLEDGASGELMVSRFAKGSIDDLRFEIHGEKGALRFSLMDGNWLYLYEGETTVESGASGWKRIEALSDYEGASTPPSRSPLSWSRTHAENIYQFLKATVTGKVARPNLIDGLRVHEVIEAAYESALNGSWVSIKRSDT
jgi:predicted dehydrogenase